MAQTLSPKEIDEQIEAAKAQADEPAAEAAIPVWEDAKSLATQLKEARRTEADFVSRLQSGGTVPELQLPEAPTLDTSLEELTARLKEVTSELQASDARVVESGKELESGTSRTSEIIEQTAKLQAQLSELSIPNEEGTVVEQAAKTKAELQKELVEAQLKSLQAEQNFLEQEQEQLPERIRARKAYNGRLAKRKELLELRVAALRRKQVVEADEALKESSKEFAHIPALAKVISDIRELNQRRKGADGLQQRTQEALEYERSITRLSQKIRDQASSADEKIRLLEKVGLGIDTDTGILLRKQRAELPRTNLLRSELKTNIEMEVRAQVALIDLQDELEDRPPLSAEEVSALALNEAKAELAEIEDPEEREELFEAKVEEHETKIEALFDQRRSLLEGLIGEYRNLKTILYRANQQSELTIANIEKYSTTLDKRLLWSRSTAPLNASEPLQEWKRMQQILGLKNWKIAWASLQETRLSRLIPAILLLVVFLFGILRRGSLREIERQRSELAKRRNCTSIRPTVETMASSVLIAATFPALFFLFAILVEKPLSLRTGFWNVGLFLLMSSLVYRFTRRDTLFESHFKFSEVKAKRIRTSLRVFIPIMVPFVFLVGALCEANGVGSSGRIAFLFAMLLVMALGHRLFHPKHSIICRLEQGKILSRVSYLLAMGIPASFFAGAALGFFSSVLTVRAQFLATLGVLLGAFLVIRFFTRWILVSRRKLAISQALKRREVALAQRAREKSGEAEGDSDVPSLEEVKAQAVDVVEVEEQTGKLVKFAVYFSVLFAIFSIWSSSLTALSILDQKRLWGGSKPVATETAKASPAVPSLLPSAAKSDEEAVASDVTADENTISSDDFVSWQDLLLALFVFLLTYVAARNIPGLLSLTVFSRLNLGPGGNFAFTTVVRYFIIFTGVVIGLNKIGITWDKVQWLAAAITLGIGFGLQEIFANFVAGLILLFERPIRLGDIVTIGDVSGKVTEIKIRATTIQQFNNRDLVVPNKDFITNQLTNWTLRDSILRFEVSVGIAYGSDTRKAEQILKKIVDDHPNILADPAPAVIFNAFGASTLDFLVRGHVGQVGNLISTQHELHFQIDDAFREAEIEISFPQQDIYIRSVPDGLTLGHAE